MGISEKNGTFFVDGLAEETVIRYKKNFWDCAHNKGKVSVCLLHENDVKMESLTLTMRHPT